MIYSAAEKNFLRVKLMYGIAESLHREKKDIEARRDPESRGSLSHLELDTFEFGQREQAILEAIIAFTVIALESLTNQALAEKINNVSLACLAIEYPRHILEKTHTKLKDAPELLQKLIILADQEKVPEDIAESVRNLVTIRNQVVHDKPFYLSTDHEGEVAYLPFNIRGKDEDNPPLRLEDVFALLKQADLVIEFISLAVELDINFRFHSLCQSSGDAE